MKITSGIIGGAQRVVLYGPEGIGKTSFAACLPAPVFIDTEGSTVRYNVRRLPAPESWPMLVGEVEWCIQNPEALRTLAVDTADWAERLCIQNILTANKVRSIEAFGYGKGYEMVQEIESRSGGLLSFNLASVYVALRRLEERGCVSSRTEMTDAARARMRVYYHLEPAAEAYLTEQKEEYRRTAVGVQNVLKSGEVQHEKEA